MSEQQQPNDEIHDQIGKLKTDLFKCIGTIESIQSKCRSRPHPAPQAPMPNDYRELFIRDLLYNFRWTAEHGNPEFFKAVEMIKREYLKPDSQLLAEHDAAIERKAREQVLTPLKEVHEKFKHLDKCLNENWSGGVNGEFIFGVSKEMWRAIKESLRQQQGGQEQPR